MVYTRFILLFALCFLLFGCLESSRKAPAELASKYENKVVLYSTSWCGYCRQMRAVLQQNHIPFMELDIEKSDTANMEFEHLGGRGIPLVLAKGRVVEGYAPKAVLQLIHGTE